MSLQSSTVHPNSRIFYKLLKLRASPINVKANVSTKRRTHYDTLKVATDATHNEIKSAYYKLTLQYHPDKNKSESAKEIFQKVAEAYEVLGNYQSRKQYDRSIAVKYRKVNQMQKPLETYAQMAPEKIYNFDEWTRMHYQETFEKGQKRKRDYKCYMEDRDKEDKRDKAYGPAVGIVITMCSFYFFTMYQMHKDKDEPVGENGS